MQEYPRGWWLASPYFLQDAAVMRIFGERIVEGPRPGPRAYGGAFLDECWTTHYDPLELLDRVRARILQGGTLALWWRPDRSEIAPEAVQAHLAKSRQTCVEDDELDGYRFQVFQDLGYREDDDYRQILRIPDNAVLVQRFGAYGDHLTSSSVISHLKEQGAFIAYFCDPKGEEVLRHDEHVDRFLIHNQKLMPSDVPANGTPLALVNAWRSRFSRYVNLNNTCERAILFRRDQNEFHFPDDARRRISSGRNYLEYAHQVAGVPFKPRQRFYPSIVEDDAAQRVAGRFGPLVMLCVAGSAEHKIWPHADRFAVQLLLTTPLNLVIAGGEKDVALAREIMQAVGRFVPDADDRVISMTGDVPLRETMALARHCKVVVGPETGILQAVAFEPDVLKFCLLSHSTAANLTRDWPNALGVHAKVPCYPCHRIHDSIESCPRHQATGRALCASAIPAEPIVREIAKRLDSFTAAPQTQRTVLEELEGPPPLPDEDLLEIRNV